MKKHILALAGLLAGAMMVTSCSQARLDEVEHLGVTEVDKTYAEADDMTAQQLIANVYVTAKYLMMGDWGVHYIATTSAKTAECWPGGSGWTRRGPTARFTPAICARACGCSMRKSIARMRITALCACRTSNAGDGS